MREITGTGTQYALDTTGVPAVLRAAVDALRPTGTLVVVGVVMGDIAFSSSGFLDGKTVKGVIEGDAYQAEFVPKMIEWHRRGMFPIEKLVKTYRLDQINEAQHDSESGATIKPIFVL